MTPPPVVTELVRRFDDNREAYFSDAYKEAHLRQEFINPLFEALGWDVQNKQGAAEAYKDVVHEEAIRIGAFTKAPDYSFRIGGRPAFFLEVKRPAVNLAENPDPAFQLRRYAWSAKLPISLLTDFEEFAVYDTRVRPARGDKASAARLRFYRYTEYLAEWDEIAGLFSREAVIKGALDRFARSTKVKKGTAEVDRAFLAQIEEWRAALAKNLAIRNPRLDVRPLNTAVQLIIDRIILLRICEDRGVESYGRLQGLANGANVHARLQEFFEQADDRYNSGLFHFREEKERREPPDDLTPRLKIDDTVLQEIIEDLYWPKSPYEFSVLPADILGQVYEQFLGKVIRLTASHQAKVEEKPEVKKAGGVYYTPTYIVDYIVKQTVGKLLEGRKPKQAAELKILDPACGSGSFLIGAYQYLLDWHRDWYVADGPEKHKRELFQGPGGAWRLTTSGRKRILLSNIYGVDIDPQAVEVAKLSLLLKVLEGESAEAISHQLKFFHERALPDLGDNIKCGNSLVGPDFYEGKQLDFLNDEERYRINAFDWSAEFPDVLRDGGFDVVIGNPPWGASFQEDELDYLRGRHERVVARMIDSYIYFLDKALSLAKANAPVGFIVPATILNQVDAQPIRRLLLDRGIRVLVNLGTRVFGPKVLNTSAIIVSAARNGGDDLLLQNVALLSPFARTGALAASEFKSWNQWAEMVRSDPHLTFYTDDPSNARLLIRLRKEHGTLQAILEGSIERGVSPDVAEAHVLAPLEARRAHLEKELLRPSVSGAQIHRYAEWTSDQVILYTTRSTPIERFPNSLKYLRNHRHLNTCKEVQQGKHPWWCLHRPRDARIFASPKFIGVTTSRKIELIYDPDSSVYATDAMYLFKTRAGVDPSLVLAVLQSRLFLFLYRVGNQGEGRVIPQVKASKLQELPFPHVETKGKAGETVRRLVEQMLLTHRRLGAAKSEHDRQVLQRQVTATDGQIDRLVYELYGLTAEEIKIVEEATA